MAPSQYRGQHFDKLESFLVGRGATLKNIENTKGPLFFLTFRLCIDTGMVYFYHWSQKPPRTEHVKNMGFCPKIAEIAKM